jgi:mono/diheme cytochrome c family protein
MKSHAALRTAETIPGLFTRRNFGGLALLAVLGLAVFWGITKPRPLDASSLPQHTADLANGEKLFNASGCHSCHLPSKDSGFDTASVAGGAPLHTPVGTLYPANITPDPETGIGQWTDADFVNAMQKGIGKSGSHLIPAFPYTSYAHMKVEDVLDIKAYLMSLAPIKNAVPDHDVLALPIVRFGLGGWKLLGLDETKTIFDTTQSDAWNRGKYLVEGPGHCSECHTPRTIVMTSNTDKYLGGGPHPEGDGKVPSLRDLVGRGKYKDVADLVSAFQFGEMMGYGKMSSGGMGKVQTNLSKLPEAELKAIAEYLVSLK